MNDHQPQEYLEWEPCKDMLGRDRVRPRGIIPDEVHFEGRGTAPPLTARRSEGIVFQDTDFPPNCRIWPGDPNAPGFLGVTPLPVRRA